MQKIELNAFVTLLENKLKKEFTDEQKEFFKDFTSPLLSFSKPGTGKTTAAVAGLLTVELFHGIPASKIKALSFTRMATAELNNRHEEACERLGIRSNITFKTLSAICTEILSNNYMHLGFNKLDIKESFSVMELSQFLTDSAEEFGIVLNPYKVRSTVNAIRTLNSSLIFDKHHVESKKCFKDTGLDFSDFTKLRRATYDLNKFWESVQVDDIFLYTLELLIKNPEIAKKHREECKVMLVDEFQDMSLLQLKLVSMLSDNVVAIGDINQQIYAFNGACQEIVKRFKEYFPNHREVQLTQSFRCGDAIANYATELVVPNDVGDARNFKGTGKFSEVEIAKNKNIQEVCREIYESFVANNNVFEDNIMFLFRNNFSAIPVAEELYKYRVPFIINKAKPAHQLPVIKDLCAFVELVRNPFEADNLAILNKCMSEFRGLKSIKANPLYKIMRETGKNFLEVPYNFKNGSEANMVMSMLLELREMYLKNAPVRELFNKIYPVYQVIYLEYYEKYLEQPASYYTRLVAPILGERSYDVFIKNELSKMEFIEEWSSKRFGIRCYTLHAAKGTEADIVYILDAEKGIIPNDSKLRETIEQGCLMDAAREVRNERSLVYVGCTRAKKKLIICYNNELSSLFTEQNNYAQLDKVFSMEDPDYYDVDAFVEFFG